MSIETKNETKKWRLPAEWEPQSMVQLTWPHAKTDWAPMLEEITKTYNEMAREISKREELLIVGEPNNDTWARDHGFIGDQASEDFFECLFAHELFHLRDGNEGFLVDVPISG